MLIQLHSPPQGSPYDAISAAELDDALFAYPSQHRFLHDASYVHGQLHAKAKPFPHPFHEPWITHLSREHSMTYATQSAYLLAAAAIARGDIEGVTMEEYKRSCRNEEAHVSKVELRFHRAIQLITSVSLQAQIETIRRQRETFFMSCRVQISDVASLKLWLTAPLYRH